jgi:DNA-binding NarL/FixJ family response regulator
MRAASVPRSRIRVFLIDDHPIVREGVRTFLNGRSATVVGEASGAAEALRKIKALAPDVIVLDVGVPSTDGGSLARRLRRDAPKARIVAFSIHSSPEYVARLAASGVHAYVAKDQPASDLLDAITTVFHGGLSFPPGNSGALLAAARAPL